MDLTGSVALITGGTAGIGEATVHRISRTGAKVVFVGRDEENGRLIESELKDEGRDAIFLRADLSVPEEVRQVVPETVGVLAGSITHSIMQAFPARTDLWQSNRKLISTRLSGQRQKPLHHNATRNPSEAASRLGRFHCKHGVGRWHAGESWSIRIHCQQACCRWIDQIRGHRIRSARHSR